MKEIPTLEPEGPDTKLRARVYPAVHQSFPSISTGAFCYPMRLAAPVALKAILDFLLKERHELGEVRMVLYTREQDQAYAVYAQALEQLLGGEATA